MAFTELTKDMNIVSMLDDEPNDVGGLTAAQLKAKFDEGGLAIKQYINKVLLPELIAKNIPFQATNGAVEAGTVQTAIEYVHNELAAVVQDGLPDGSVTLNKLAQDFFENYYSKSDAMTVQDVRAVCT